MPHPSKLRYVFFGSSRFSELVLKELETTGFVPLLKVSSAKAPLPSLEDLRALDADVFIVASFGKILPQELLDIPKHGSLNVHPSLLPELRGPAPIQGLILGEGAPGVTIIKMDEKMDHGPIIAQEKITLEPWPMHYALAEERLGEAGGKLLANILPDWIEGNIEAKAQDESAATYIKLVKKEDGLLDLNADAEQNLRKVLAYSTWPGAHFIFKSKNGKDIRLVIKDAQIMDGKFTPTRVIPSGKREMSWQEFLLGNA
jgi:methionyl-tRNA formyltransferase